MRASLLLIAMSLALWSCSSPPKPPTVDESLKRPANAAVAVELQVCKSELQNTRILASETSRLAESASHNSTQMATRLALQQQALAARPAAADLSGEGLFGHDSPCGKWCCATRQSHR